MATTPSLDLGFVRQQFPAFAHDDVNRYAFFDNAGGTYVCRSVIARLTEFYTQYKVQPYGSNPLAYKAGHAMDAGRQAMVDLLGIDSEQLTLNTSTTQNINTLALACSTLVQAGQRVIVSEQDHEANIGAWQRLCERQGADFVLWPVEPDTGELALDTLSALIDDKTALLCVTHSSNIIGSINPIAKIADIAHGHNAKLIVDGVSYAPHSWPNWSELGADAYVFSTYKTYSTHMGVMILDSDFRDMLDPQCHFFNNDYAAKKLDSAGPDHASIAALAGLQDYLVDVYENHIGPVFGDKKAAALGAYQLFHQHENALFEHLLDGIKDLPLRIYGRTDTHNREANLAMSTPKMTSQALCEALVNYDVGSNYGHFYAYRLLEKMGVSDMEDGVLRISLAHYNVQDEVDRCITGLREILG